MQQAGADEDGHVPPEPKPAAQSEAAPEAQTKAGGPAEATHPDQRDEHTPKP